MTERQLPSCPFCGKKMVTHETNDAFFFCKGDKERQERHYQDILYSTTYFPDGDKPDSGAEEKTPSGALSDII